MGDNAISHCIHAIDKLLKSEDIYGVWLGNSPDFHFYKCVRLCGKNYHGISTSTKKCSYQKSTIRDVESMVPRIHPLT